MKVAEEDTAEAMRTGTVPVLATPRLIALCEEAACQAIDGHLAKNCTSVAKRCQFDHLVPVGVGGTVWAEATLDRIEGRRLVFTLSVSESAGLVAAGKLIRVVVDRETFLSNVR
jgi:predicted thioesterase